MTREELIVALRLQDVDGEEQDSLVKGVLATVDERFANIIDETLSSEQAKELDAAADTENFETIQQWIKEHMPHASEVYDAVLRDYVDELREGFTSQR